MFSGKGHAVARPMNRLALRPHNCGHSTLDASSTSQFEQQVRTLAALRLGDTTTRIPLVMQNLLHDSEVTPDGYPESVCRMWESHLSCCDALFTERALGDVQMLLSGEE
jgi:phosphoribosylaminoimidazole carboxylase (NCAIR synthetase)